MSQASQHKLYKSPQRKLVQFFEKSRNQWKTKYFETKSVMKRLQNRIRFLEKSREHWKKKAKEHERELIKMHAKQRKWEQQALIVKKRQSRRLHLLEILRYSIVVFPIIPIRLATSCGLYLWRYRQRQAFAVQAV